MTTRVKIQRITSSSSTIPARMAILLCLKHELENVPESFSSRHRRRVTSIPPDLTRKLSEDNAPFAVLPPSGGLDI